MVFTGWTINRDPRQEFRAHRCKGSLENHVSIRYYNKPIIDPQEGNTWRALSAKYYRMSFSPWQYSMPIRFCPFCGKRLWPMAFTEMYSEKGQQ